VSSNDIDSVVGRLHTTHSRTIVGSRDASLRGLDQTLLFVSSCCTMGGKKGQKSDAELMPPPKGLPRRLAKRDSNESAHSDGSKVSKAGGKAKSRAAGSVASRGRASAASARSRLTGVAGGRARLLASQRKVTGGRKRRAPAPELDTSQLAHAVCCGLCKKKPEDSGGEGCRRCIVIHSLTIVVVFVRWRRLLLLSFFSFNACARVTLRVPRARLFRIAPPPHMARVCDSIICLRLLIRLVRLVNMFACYCVGCDRSHSKTHETLWPVNEDVK